MELLDVYDEKGNYIDTLERNYVHQNALWHKTVHCWLYDKFGNIYFQIRADRKTYYTTASGHVVAGETIKEAFGREIKEEIGLCVDYDKAILVDVVTFKMDKVKKDGSVFKDRVFANVYVLEFDENLNEFDFDLNEVDGLIKVNAKETLDMFEKGYGEVPAYKIINDNGQIISIREVAKIGDFLVNEGETLISKYGDILKKVIELTEK